MKLREHYSIITGKSVYTDDINFPDMLYLGVVRSTYARAIVKSYTEPSGVELFLDWNKVKTYMPVRPDPRAKNIVKMPVVSDGRINFVGQPIVAFVVKDRYEIEDKIDEVSVDYDPLKPVLTIDESLKNEEKIHTNGNIAIDIDLSGGEVEKRLTAEVTVEREILQDRIVANPMEPKGVIANFDGDKLYIIGSFQSSFRIRSDLQEALGLPPEKIIVKSAPNVGGGFGNKVPAHPEYVLAAIASMILRKPIKWIETRREHLTNPTQGRGVKSKVKLYGRKDGTILGLEGEVIVDLGAYAYTINTTTPAFIAGLLNGPYKMRFMKIRALGVYTNKPPTGPYRGAGRPEAALITETLVEDFAEAIGMDSVEVRKKNFLDGEFITPLGIKIDKADYTGLIEKGEKIYRSLKEKYKDKGVALIAFTEVVRASPGEGAKIRVGKGKVELFVGTGPHGQAHQSTFALLASEILGLPPEKIDVNLNDTENIKEGIGSFGSRSAAAGGSAVIEVCKGLLEVLKKKGKTLEEAINSDEYTEVETFYKTSDIYTPGVHIAIVDIDETYKPRVVEYYAIDDVGRAIIKDEVEGQIIGGILQGISQVYLEWAPYDENGNPIYASIAEAGVPTSLESEYKLTLEFVETPANLPSGARGVGEAGTTGALPATFIALEKLLKRKFNKTPILPSELITP
ncbi:xanthine dehydrogenase family protein molybdopterin-binding subunit [Sulfurisphaera ohwakuensis]|uniref:CO/xanthine dehydrogenase Mo-binding subunit n=1 Tax=Sulfurisphaera ohwakuensis TaxID=69656 RepID=A0A650CF54_SULOH|nr:xanthine dehydrogenase family protein molybdopterin-binding subunit [Sulfurisphaera ohwakuensis]MBB5254844.1 CO/xanthine dehydrogenase Mo-binding subunit [Sulfurisphaera ohwakuensis]QGR16386.1 molybdopterin-dependent oxidoreductase [Sulfurisphaera ohwakuensis]